MNVLRKFMVKEAAALKTTAVIATGDFVEVDGDLGLVTRPGA